MSPQEDDTMDHKIKDWADGAHSCTVCNASWGKGWPLYLIETSACVGKFEYVVPDWAELDGVDLLMAFLKEQDAS